MSRAKRVEESRVVAVDALLRAVQEKPDGVLIPGLGVFWVGVRPARTIRNPVTKRLMRLPETTELRFRAVKAARDAVKSIVVAGNGPPLHEAEVDRVGH